MTRMLAKLDAIDSVTPWPKFLKETRVQLIARECRVASIKFGIGIAETRVVVRHDRNADSKTGQLYATMND